MRLAALFIGVLAAHTVTAQCTFGGTNFGDVTPAGPGLTNTLTNFAWGGDQYDLNVQAGETYVVSLCNATPSWDSQITIFDETATDVAFNDDFCGLLSEVTFTAATTGLYTVQVNQFFCTTNSGPGLTIDVTWQGTAPPASGGDDCASASPVVCGDSFTGSTVGAPVNIPNDPAFCGTAYGTGGGQWFSYVGTGDLVTVSLCGSSYDTRIHVVSGDCVTQTCVAGNDDFCGLQSELTFTSTLGTQYYFYVNGFGASEGDFVLNVTCAAVVGGCTNPIACNFDPAATVDDGTCEFLSCAGCTDGTACNFDPAATLDDGSCDFSCLGCLDNAACNFDAGASIDDGSCCFDNCLTIDMTDSFGDGWNGATYSITDASTGTVVASGDLDNADSGDGSSAGTDELCLVDGCYFVAVGGGTFDIEVGWTVNGADNPASGGANLGTPALIVVNGGCTPGCTDPTACNFDNTADQDDGSCDFVSCAGCTDPLATNWDPAATIDDGSCVFCAPGEVLAIFDMTDSFGDGWNGATYNVQDVGTGTSVASGDLDGAAIGDGVSVGTDGFCLAPGCYTLTVGGGTFDGEIGWTFSDNLGNNYGSGGAVTGSGIDFGFTGTCGFEGCTDPNANNFDPNASVDDGSCVLPPANNECVNAEAVTCGSTVNGTTIDATDAEGLIGTACGGPTIDSPGVWYIFNAASDQQVIASLCNSAGGDTKIHVYQGDPDCSNLLCIGANDDSCGLLSEIAFAAETGNDYYIYVSEFGGFGTGLDFTLDITCQDCDAIPANDDCVDATPLPTNGSVVPGSLCCANPSDAPNFSAGFATAYDVFFTVNTGTFDDLFFQADNISGTDVGIMVYTGSCGSLVDEVGGIAAGTIAGTLSQFAPFQPFPANTDITFAVFTTDPAGCGDFEIFVEGLILGCTDSAANNFDPLANEDDGSCDYTGVTPANDDCANAEVLTCNTTVTGSTGGATANAPTLLPCDPAPGTGVWYVLTGNDELTTISTCGSVIDSKINVWTAADCAGPFSCVTQLDGSFASETEDFESCGFFDQDDVSVSFIADAGVNYYVYVGAQDIDGNPITDDNGAFVLDITCEAVVEGCTNPVAYNFDPLANVENGTCDFFSQTCGGGAGTPVQFNMEDSFGDGWNDATYTIEDGLGNVVATGDLDGALFTIDEDNFPGPESGFDLLCLQDGCYTIIVGGGTFDIEISFDITDELGNVLVSGGAGEFPLTIGGAICGCTDNTACNFDPVATDDDGSCEFESCAGCTDNTACNFDNTATIDDGSCCFDNCVTVDMTDSFGDGWDGAVYEIYSIDGTLVATGDLDTAESGDGASNGQDVLCLVDDCYYIIVTGGAFPGEVSWSLFGVNGGPISGGAPTTIDDFVTFSVGAGACVTGCTEPVACNFDPAANIADCEACEYATCLGCTYDDADNYDMTATIDDGSCTFSIANPCPTDINQDGITNTADLTLFLGAFGTPCN